MNCTLSKTNKRKIIQIKKKLCKIKCKTKTYEQSRLVEELATTRLEHRVVKGSGLKVRDITGATKEVTMFGWPKTTSHRWVACFGR